MFRDGLRGICARSSDVEELEPAKAAVAVEGPYRTSSSSGTKLVHRVANAHRRCNFHARLMWRDCADDGAEWRYATKYDISRFDNVLEARMHEGHVWHALERAEPEIGAPLHGIEFPLDAVGLAAAAYRLVEARSALPQPGGGKTLARWRFLAAVAARDLPLVKIFEAHADAIAILTELDAHRPRTGDAAPDLWAVWAARAPHNDLRITWKEGQQVRLSGTKPWCSGAAFVTHALVTCVDDEQNDWLAALRVMQPNLRVSTRGWHAVGMLATQSVEIDMDGADAVLIGPPRAYLERPGFWHGGAGIAACWYGAAAALAVRLREVAARRKDPHLHAHFGEADAALAAARALLRESARCIDTDPRAFGSAAALRVRAAVEDACDTVLRACARGLGAGPLCQDAWFAHMTADLAVFMRQSHAERDLASLGGALAGTGENWQL
ncbi:acyl-CoA dehydrogenase [Paraburkholderia tropica]|uniref:acyl-CoA dehydrogenase n=1 Tax=Paraburkholderia tropica TaxID=92647 RepID=UPI0012E9DF60|nr:acyl-CoA dehydrogenase [Paraburkholderia tropica]